MQNILIIDDNLDTLQLLGEMLKAGGYGVQPLSDGRQTVSVVRSRPPDLILLDINMPGINGYQVCEELKADPELKEIPVLFLSALGDAPDIVRGFHAGGVDYITKPFQIEEVKGRVQLHLELRRQKRQLQQSYDRLRELEQLRDNLIPKPRQEVARALGAARICSQRLSEMTTQLLDIHRLEERQMPLHQIEADLVQTAKTAIAASGHFSGPSLNLNAPESVPAIYDPEIVRRVLENLLGNACKFTPDSGEVRVSVIRQGEFARVSVADSGPGIPPQYHERIFEKFAQVDGETKRFGAGLGLAFCKLAVEAHGGNIGLESDTGKGSTFWFSLPLSRRD